MERLGHPERTQREERAETQGQPWGGVERVLGGRREGQGCDVQGRPLPVVDAPPPKDQASLNSPNLSGESFNSSITRVEFHILLEMMKSLKQQMIHAQLDTTSIPSTGVPSPISCHNTNLGHGPDCTSSSGHFSSSPFVYIKGARREQPASPLPPNSLLDRPRRARKNMVCLPCPGSITGLRQLIDLFEKARKVSCLLTEVYMAALIQGIQNHELTRKLDLHPPRSICELNEVIARHVSTETTENWRGDAYLSEGKPPETEPSGDRYGPSHQATSGDPTIRQPLCEANTGDSTNPIKRLALQPPLRFLRHYQSMLLSNECSNVSSFVCPPKQPSSAYDSPILETELEGTSAAAPFALESSPSLHSRLSPHTPVRLSHFCLRLSSFSGSVFPPVSVFPSSPAPSSLPSASLLSRVQRRPPIFLRSPSRLPLPSFQPSGWPACPYPASGSSFVHDLMEYKNTMKKSSMKSVLKGSVPAPRTNNHDGYHWAGTSQGI
ncbi:hypothetical protein ACLOJK_025666 [Asimina triloba]